MKNLAIFLSLLLLGSSGFSQEMEIKNQDSVQFSYNLFDCRGWGDKYFLAANIGVKQTMFGLRAGFFCKTGGYVGVRFGRGDVYHNETDLTTTKTALFSVTGGIIIPVYIQDKFGLYAFAGGGYGQWWHFRWETWTKEGYELEAGLNFSYKRLMLQLSANRLDGYLTHSTFDFTIGLGYRFSGIKLPFAS
jgi:hypothetical protein